MVRHTVHRNIGVNGLVVQLIEGDPLHHLFDHVVIQAKSGAHAARSSVHLDALKDRRKKSFFSAELVVFRAKVAEMRDTIAEGFGCIVWCKVDFAVLARRLIFEFWW